MTRERLENLFMVLAVFALVKYLGVMPLLFAFLFGGGGLLGHE